MTMMKLKLRPGVDTQATPTLNTARISESGLIRFYQGLPQKRGGWQAINATPLVGTCSGLHGWSSITGSPYLACGTEQRLQLLVGGTLEDITPIIATENPAVAFSTTTGQSTVTITDSSYQPAVGDWVNLVTQVSVGGVVLYGYYRAISTTGVNQYSVTASALATGTVTNGGAVPTFTTIASSTVVTVALASHGLTVGAFFPVPLPVTVGGTTLNGTYTVSTVINANSFTITAVLAAASGATVALNGGNAQIQYLLPSGVAADTFVTSGGYGAGPYGGGPYGAASGTPTLEPQRVWSLDNFGQDLIASPSGGSIYYWQPPAVAPATLVSNTAPVLNTSVFVMSQAQIIIALGAEVSGTQQPMLVRWCDAGDFTDWTATAFNQAGSYTVPLGSKLIAGLALGIGALLWTDIGLYQMTYQGLPFVFGFQPVGTGCGLVGPRAFALTGSLIFWLSPHGFWAMAIGAGVPMPMECDVWDILIDNADFADAGSFVMGATRTGNEFELFFPLEETSPFYVEGSVTTGSIKYNHVEKAWDYTISPQLQRTAWQSHWVSGTGDHPVGADTQGFLQQHEVGFDANGTGMQWFWQTGAFDAAEGEEIIFLDQIIPDFVTLGNAIINVSVITWPYPNGPSVEIGPFPLRSGSMFLPVSVRGRQFAIKCYGSDVGSFNRLGAMRLRIAPDGRGA